MRHSCLTTAWRQLCAPLDRPHIAATAPQRALLRIALLMLLRKLQAAWLHWAQAQGASERG